MTSKKIISLGLFLMGILAFPAFGGNVTMQPLYTDARFQPVDAFHAGCNQDAQFTLNAKEKNITEIHLVVNYAPGDIEISRVLGADNAVADYKMEYSSIVLDVVNLDKTAQDIPLFHIAFQSNETVLSTDIQIATGSYYLANGKKILLNQTLPLTFETVPECNPDVIPPSIKLLYPKTPKERLTLDQYFIFDIKDIGKGIDKNSVKISFNGQVFLADVENIKWNGDYLTFYPQDWLPIDADLTLSVSIGDQQVYGGPNATEKEFRFQTTTGLVLQDSIGPMAFRMIARQADKIFGTPSECTLLKNIYAGSDALVQPGLIGIFEKLSCDTTDLSSYVPATTDTTHGAAPETTSNRSSYLSVFAIMGWILFMISFSLKLHYFVSYRKHKKLAEFYKKN